MDYNLDDMGAEKAPFYIMSRVSQGGLSDVLVVPTKSGLVRIAWRKGSRDIPAADLPETWMAVENAPDNEVFGVSFLMPHLDHILVAAGHNNFNYMILYPTTDPPKMLSLRCAAMPGTADDVARWAARFL